MRHIDLVGLTTGLALRRDDLTLHVEDSLRISALLA